MFSVFRHGILGLSTAGSICGNPINWSTNQWGGKRVCRFFALHCGLSCRWRRGPKQGLRGGHRAKPCTPKTPHRIRHCIPFVLVLNWHYFLQRNFLKVLYPAVWFDSTLQFILYHCIYFWLMSLQWDLMILSPVASTGFRYMLHMWNQCGRHLIIRSSEWFSKKPSKTDVCSVFLSLAIKIYFLHTIISAMALVRTCRNPAWTKSSKEFIWK